MWPRRGRVTQTGARSEITEALSLFHWTEPRATGPQHKGPDGVRALYRDENVEISGGEFP